MCFASATPAWGEVMFVGTGADGEASFTDAALDGFTATRLDVPAVTPAAAEETRRIVADMASMARALAEERREREQARAPAPPPVQPPEPVVVDYRYPLFFAPPHRRRSPAVAPPPAPAPRKPFEPAFRPFAPVNHAP